MEFFLRQLKLAYVLTQPCPTIPIKEFSSDQVKTINGQIDKWNDDDYFCRNHILSEMTDSFYDQYSKKSKTATELWNTLKSVYQAEESSTKKFLVSNYMDFKMTDDRPVSVPVRELQLIANDICAVGMVLDENFHIGAIVAKLPPTWKEYRNKLKHKKEDLALDQLMQHLHIEEETRNREKEPAKETIVKAHVVVDKDEKKNSRRHNQNKFLKPKNSKGFKPLSSNAKAKNKECYNCHKIGHVVKDCYQLKHGSDKKKNRKEFDYFDTFAPVADYMTFVTSLGVTCK
ncbi:hypothetical protein RJ639_006004 [Escallonia herrerae]|uniref:CCHC-type domain-containing protein n=1 Tax=Escallonia herrerae TaxID=1293975 RepID=A0AA88W021_9ASTE|nr:hypothetical protein RJ639_006004 [Escallonia herrerae]